MKKNIALFSILLLMLHGMAAIAQTKITVAVAANMQPAMEQLKTEFEKETGTQVELIIGASGKLSAQITEGAPFDVFVSADMKYPEGLFAKGFATAKPKPYAIGQLVLWTAKPGIVPAADLKVLLLAAVQKIAIANPKTAPYGEAAEQALRYYKLYDQVKEKLVYGESIGQTEQFISTQAADIGFIAKSQVLAPGLKDKGRWADIDKSAYAPITQGAVILKHGKETNSAIAEQFYVYLYSGKAQAIFKKLGYTIP